MCTSQVSNTVSPIQRRPLDMRKRSAFKGQGKEYLQMLQQKLLLRLFYYLKVYDRKNDFKSKF